MEMGMGYTMRMTLAMECSTCGQLVLDENSAAIEAALFGTKFYAVCLHCFQETNDRSVKYRRKWLRIAVAQIKARTAPLSMLAKEMKRRGLWRPGQRCRVREWGNTRAKEFISYPYIQDGEILIKVREIGKPCTMRTELAAEAIPTMVGTAGLDGAFATKGA